MFRNIPHIAIQRIENRVPLRGFLAVSAVFGAVLAVAAFYTFGSATVALTLFAIMVTLGAYGLMHGYAHPVIGLCNTVTLARAAMVAFLAGAVLFTAVSAWVVFAVALVAFALDGVDGWLARRSGLVSAFGARFDMETDAALGAVMSLWLLASGTTGPEILVLGLMRYAFVGAGLVWPALQAPLPEALRRKAICVVQIGALIVLTFPLTPAWATAPIGIVAALLLGWSFLVDTLWLARRAA